MRAYMNDDYTVVVAIIGLAGEKRTCVYNVWSLM